MKIRSSLFSRTVVISFLFAIWASKLLGAEPTVTPFQNGDSICYLGDSITHDGYYWEFIHAYYVTRHPKWKISFFDCGYTGDMSGGGASRIEEDVLANHPNKVVIMYGMNDVGREQYSKNDMSQPPLVKTNVLNHRAEVRQWYEKNLRTIIESLKKKKVQVILVSPTPYDQTQECDTQNHYGANGGLEEFTTICLKLSKEYGTDYVDLNSPMTKINEGLQKVDPAASLIDKDRVHPKRIGHWVMAYLFLKAQNADSDVCSVSADFAAKSVSATKCKAEIARFDGSRRSLTLKLVPEALPLPVVDGASDSDRIVPLLRSLSQQYVTIKSLPEGDYDVSVGGSGYGGYLGQFSSTQLARGIDIGSHPASAAQIQAKEVHALLREKADIMRLSRNVKMVEKLIAPVYIAKGILPDDPQTWPTVLKHLVENKKIDDSYLVRDYLEYAKRMDQLRQRLAYLTEVAIPKAAIPRQLILSIKKAETTRYSSDVVLSFDFEEGMGQYLNDKSGHGSVGMLGSTYTKDADDPVWEKVGDSHWALSFDGSKDKVMIEPTALLNPVGELTISARIKRTGDQGGVIVNKGWSDYALLVTPSGHLGFQYRNELNELYSVDSACFVPLNEWMTIGVSVNTSKKKIDFLANGSVIDTWAFHGMRFAPSNQAFLAIGFNASQKVLPFKGWIDKLTIIIPGNVDGRKQR